MNGTFENPFEANAAPTQAVFAAFQQQHLLHRSLVNGQVWEYLDTRPRSPGDAAPSEEDVLLMLPGFFGVAGTDFLYILAFEAQFRVISVTYPETEARVDGLVDGLAGFMAGLGIAQIHLLGGSYSGYIAQVFVRRYPERVRSLILAQTGAPRRRHLPLALGLAALVRLLPSGILRWLMLRTNAHFLPGSSPQQAFWRAYFHNLILAFSHRALYHRFRVVLDYHFRYRFAAADLDAWPGEILLLESAQDDLLSHDDVELLRRLYPRALRSQVAGEHAQSVYQPEAQIASIRQFLQQRGML